MRKSPLALLLSLICLISSHNEIQAQGHPPTDSLRQRAAASVGKEKHDLLMRIAMSTNDIADWDATLNDAIDRYDTPAICQSRLNRIQCLFNFYSVDSAIIEAQESLPFILDAKQYSFYFSTYNTYISGLFKQRRFDEAREEATTMFETAQQVKQPVGMTMALQVQGINSACTTKPSPRWKKGSLYAPLTRMARTKYSTSRPFFTNGSS